MKLVNFLKEEQSESLYVYAQCVLKILEEEEKKAKETVVPLFVFSI